MTNKKYSAKIAEMIDHGEGYWKTIIVGVWEETEGINVTDLSTLRMVGKYERNYSEFFNTFFPFMCSGEWYALYSPEYTVTRIMKLPECIDIGGEDSRANGFCPVDYYVPFIDDAEKEYCDFGFVSGCVWGDDASMKLQFLNLSEVRKGILKRDSRLGYIELPDGLRLSEIISLDLYDDIRTMTTYIPRTFNIDTGNVVHRVWDIDKNWAFSELALAVESAYRISTLATIDSIFTNLSDVCAKVSRDFGMPDQQLLIHSLVKDMIVDRRGSSNIFTWIERTKR